MIENILIIDTETTGLSPGQGARLIEVCGVLYNVQHQSVLQIYSTLFPCKENDAYRINKISPELTQLKYTLQSIPTIQLMANCSQALVAHNARFDKQFVDREFPYLRNKEWVCTKDFAWPVELSRRRLQDVCEAMGVTYKNGHRAYGDCLLLVECFNKIENLSALFNPELSTDNVDISGEIYSK